MKPKYPVLIFLIAISMGVYYLLNSAPTISDKAPQYEAIASLSNYSSVSSVASLATNIDVLNFNTSSSVKSKSQLTSEIKHSERNASQQYSFWAREYAKTLPPLFKAKMARNFTDINVLYNLQQLTNAGDVNAKKQFLSELKKLKEHADTGNVSAQMDYASSIRQTRGTKEEIEFYWDESNQYFIKAAASGQALAATNLSGDLIRRKRNEPEEALAWDLIAIKLGAGFHAGEICIQSRIACTEEIFSKAADRALFYIDFYEFKQSEQ